METILQRFYKKGQLNLFITKGDWVVGGSWIFNMKNSMYIDLGRYKWRYKKDYD